MRIPAVVPHGWAGRQTDRLTDMTKLVFTYRSFVNVPKIGWETDPVTLPWSDLVVYCGSRCFTLVVSFLFLFYNNTDCSK